MAQQLIVAYYLTEDPVSVANTHMRQPTKLGLTSGALWPLWAPAHTRYTYRQAGTHVHTYVKEERYIFFKCKNNSVIFVPSVDKYIKCEGGVMNIYTNNLTIMTPVFRLSSYL